MKGPLRTPAECVDLAARVHQGDRDAEEEFAHLFAPGIEAMAISRLRQREDVNELVDDVLMAVLLALRKGTVRETGSLVAFVHGTAVRLIQNRRRSLARRAPMQELESDPPGPDSLAILERADEIRVCHRALDTLSEIDRQILYLTLVEGMKPGEIADRVGLSRAAVRQRKSRAVKHLIEAVGNRSQTRSREPL